MMHADDLTDRLRLTRFAQPLLFAIQSAACAALRRLGLAPTLVLGHSVGEVAAAEAAGFLDRDAALHTIHARSLHQELAFDHGGMAVLIGSPAATEAILADLPGLEVAAFNSPRACTVSGDKADLARLPDVARRHAGRVRMLDLAYPFHSERMCIIEQPLRKHLAGVTFGRPHTPFLSTVDAAVLMAGEMTADYWWRNVREPVRFTEAVAKARQRNIQIFLEIGPTATLLSHISETIEDRNGPIAALAALSKRDDGIDPLAMAVMSAISRGAEVDEKAVFGSGVAAGAKVTLPHYPWQRQRYRLTAIADLPAASRASGWHPLIGSRVHPDRLEWTTILDTTLHPWLADHCVDGRVILPGAAFAEMALAVAQDWCGGGQAVVSDIDISSALQLAPNTSLDLLCRVSQVGNQLEILSRPRFSALPLQLHVTAKIIRDPKAGCRPTPRICLGWPAETLSGDVIYGAAARAGLSYGPAFRKLTRAARAGPDRIVVDLVDEPGSGLYGIDPARLDACFHALVLLFAQSDLEPVAGYIPVRIGEIQLHKPSTHFIFAEIDVRRHDERAIIVDVILTDAAGETVAVLRDARFQPFRVNRPVHTHPFIVERATILAPEPTASPRDRPLSIEKLRDGVVKDAEEARLSDEYLLLEGWATSLALETMRGLATNGVISVADLVATGVVPGQLRPWLDHALLALERSGLCHAETGVHVLDVSESGLPSPDEILRVIAHRHQARAVELLAAASIQQAVRSLLAGEPPEPFGKIVEDFEANARPLAEAAEILVDVIRRSVSAWPRDRAIRILQIGHGPLTRLMAALSQTMSSQLTLLEEDRRWRDRARTDLADGVVEIVETVADLPAASFDLVVAASKLAHRIEPFDMPNALRRVMAPDAILAAIEPGPSFFRDFIIGLQSCLAGSSQQRTDSRTNEWRSAVGVAFEARIDEISTPAGQCSLLTAQLPAERRHRTGSGRVVIVGDAASCHLQTALATLLALSGVHVTIMRDSAIDSEPSKDTPKAVVVLCGSDARTPRRIHLSQRCMRLKQLTDRFGRQSTCLWLVGASGADTTGTDEAVFAFARTLANEMPNIDVRRVEVARDLAKSDFAARLRDLILSGTDETDIVLDMQATRVVRFVPHPTADAVMSEAARLQRGNGAGMDRLGWQPTERVAPGPGDVEIGVEAISVNFRDVMFGLGLLPDDILERGFAGPTLGLECVGRVLRAGVGVASPKPGDRVIAFARNAFTTHAVTPATLTVPISEHVSSEAAATIPVAFTTAYYALVTCARLKPREWVLIHGGAGGVGLAALQIARWRGARVIATAGSPGKRALLRALGAEHAFDSRSGTFVNDVRRVTREGVAVVLNSLSGEAMERSLALLRPFGRFVELGKRDYVANTHVGLRPFHRNLTYFGVDLDQLLVDEPKTSRRLFQAVMRLFERGVLVPLPFRSLDAARTIEAFRLMQQSGHIGKLVVRPPEPSRIAAVPRQKSITFDAEKTHLVTGGCGGFGLATAKWLAANGARTIVLLGRQGAASEEARTAVRDLTTRGSRIVVEAVDVADGSAMARVFARFGADLPSLSSVFHAAMVLDDALLANLTAERLELVLAPKAAGADILDALTRDMPLDHFVLYSSVTTLLGNPGQAAYVAANGYLEGLARRRRKAGLPGLAAAWGAIADVGVLARSEATRDLLESRAGVKSMSAQEALTCLGKVLAAPDAHDAVVAIAPMDWSTARRHLKVLAAPAYRALGSGEDAVASPDGKIDLGALVAGSTPEAARKTIADLIVEDIARVLRMPNEDVVRSKPLAEIGLDSLMAVELALGLEGRFTLAAPLSTTASSFSVNELTDHILAVETGVATSDEDVARRMIGRHVQTSADAALAADVEVDVAEDAKIAADHMKKLAEDRASSTSLLGS